MSEPPVNPALTAKVFTLNGPGISRLRLSTERTGNPNALFVLDDAAAMDVILHKIQGLGGTVLKTNVDLERAKLIQSTLAAALPNEGHLSQ